LNTQRVAPDAEITLHRAVALAEAADVETHGFRLGPNTMPGKWFAARPGDAERWGRALYAMQAPAEPFKIVSIRLPATVVDQLYFEEMLDGIGPAYFAVEAQLPMLNATGTIVVGRAVYYP
jgi:hypothetical protein